MSDRYDSPKPASSSIFSPARETGTPYTDEPLSNARRRAERIITEDSFFDSRGARVPKNTIGEAIREFDDEVCAFGWSKNKKILFSQINHKKSTKNNDVEISSFYFLGKFNFWQFKSTISKIRASKQAANYSNAADADFDDVDTFKRRNRTDFKSTLDDGIGHAASSIRKSAYKVRLNLKTLLWNK